MVRRLMQAGKIYTMNYGFEPPELGKKYRPALVMFVDSDASLAYVCKITKSKPNRDFPYREQILHKDFAKLHYDSYVQYNWFDTVPITARHKYMGTLHTSDFGRIFGRFKSFHGL